MHCCDDDDDDDDGCSPFCESEGEAEDDGWAGGGAQT